MSINNFIPVVWAKKILENLDTAHVAVDCANREYEGEIREQGDSVKINSIGRPTIFTITKNTNIDAVQVLNDSAQVLVVDQARGFNFQVDDIDKAQQKPSVMAYATRQAAYAMADVVDQYLINAYYAGASSGTPDNVLDIRALGTGAGDGDAYETMVDLGVKLTESDVPSTGRWILIPPWVEGLLRKDPRFVSFGTNENAALLRNGTIGRAAGFTVKVSNNIYNSAVTNSWANSVTYAMIAGTPEACTYAEQLTKTVPYTPELRFADALKGELVFGAKVVRPNCLAVCPVTAA